MGNINVSKSTRGIGIDNVQCITAANHDKAQRQDRVKHLVCPNNRASSIRSY